MILKLPQYFLQRARKLAHAHTSHPTSRLPTPTLITRPLHHNSSSSEASRPDGLSSPQAQASGDAKRALAPFGGSPGWRDEDSPDCDGHNVIVLYVPQPAPRAHPCCRDCGDRPGQSGHPRRGLRLRVGHPHCLSWPLVSHARCRCCALQYPLPRRGTGQCGRVVRPTLKVAEVRGLCPCKMQLLE